MAQEKEQALPIEDFGGVNRNVDREKLHPVELHTAQNLWEPNMGVLNSRPGSSHFTNPVTLPSNVVSLDAGHKVYKVDGGHRRIVAAKTTPVTGLLAALPTGVSVSLVDEITAYWSHAKPWGIDATATWSGTHESLMLRFVGYGLDKWIFLPYTAISGYNASFPQKLVVTIANNLDGEFGAGVVCTGFEVYAVVKCGSTGTVGPVVATAGYNNAVMWCAFEELVTKKTGTFEYKNTPLGFGGTTNVGIGANKRNFNATSSPTGGNLKGGKIYYVMVMSHRLRIPPTTPGAESECFYHAPSVNVFGGDIVSVVIPGNTNTGSITLSGFSDNTVSYLVCIGEHWQCMYPYKVFNDNTASNAVITDFPRYSPGMIDFEFTSYPSSSLFKWRYSDYSVNDCHIGVEDNGSIFPVFNSRVKPLFVNWNKGAIDALLHPVTTFNWLGTKSYMGRLQDDAQFTPSYGGFNYQYAEWEDLVVGCTGKELAFNDNKELVYYPSRSSSNLMVGDGNGFGYVTIRQLFLPPASVLIKFDSSLCFSGVNTGGKPGQILWFSRPFEFWDWAIPTTSVLQGVAIDQDSEGIVGLGIYTNTATDQGPQSQLVLAKSNSTWILNELPEVSGSSLGAAQLGQLSGKVGAAHKHGFVNTPLGLVMLDNDNVYLIRGDGEPAPIGQEISPVLRAADLDRAKLVYHDRQVKLAFRDPSVSGPAGRNNVEWWLDVNKMIELKGSPTWYGPMVGRSVDFSIVEDRQGDGLTFNVARDRIAISFTGKQIYKADVFNLETDLGAAIQAILETKDFNITSQDNNWMKHLKRYYWKIRCVGPISASSMVWVDGVLKENKTISFEGDGVSSFDNQPLKLFRYFPDGRQFGRTMRLRLTTTGRLGIGGFQLNYQIVNRRL